GVVSGEALASPNWPSALSPPGGAAFGAVEGFLAQPAAAAASAKGTTRPRMMRGIRLCRVMARAWSAGHEFRVRCRWRVTNPTHDGCACQALSRAVCVFDSGAEPGPQSTQFP